MVKFMVYFHVTMHVQPLNSVQPEMQTIRKFPNDLSLNQNSFKFQIDVSKKPILLGLYYCKIIASFK